MQCDHKAGKLFSAGLFLRVLKINSLGTGETDVCTYYNLAQRHGSCAKRRRGRKHSRKFARRKLLHSTFAKLLLRWNSQQERHFEAFNWICQTCIGTIVTPPTSFELPPNHPPSVSPVASAQISPARREEGEREREACLGELFPLSFFTGSRFLLAFLFLPPSQPCKSFLSVRQLLPVPYVPSRYRAKRSSEER